MARESDARTHVRNSRGEGDRLRDLIVAAATALVDEGTDAGALSLRSVARRAGISAPSIYPHFASLELVVAAVIDDGFVDLRTLIEQARGSAPDPASALLGACVAYFEFGRSHVELYRAMFSPNGYGPESGTALELLERMLADCVESRASASTDTHGDAFLLWAAMHGMTTIARPSRQEDWRLGAANRSELFVAMVNRLARLTSQPTPTA